MLKTKFILVGLMVAGLGHADLFDNLPADQGHSWDIEGANGGFNVGYQAFATSFVATSTWTLSDIQVAVAYSSGDPSIVVELMLDNLGTPDGVLDSQTITLPATYSGLVSATFTDVLAPGTYWVGVLPGVSGTANDSTASFFQNSSLSATEGFSGDGVSWGTFSNVFPGVIEIDGAASASAPEPSSILLLASLVGGLGMAIKRKRSVA